MVTTVALLDDGTGGDATVGDGVYTSLFTNTFTPGTYVVGLRSTWPWLRLNRSWLRW